MTGKRFGRWLVLERKENSSGRNARWLCRCDCGRERIVDAKSLRNGTSQTCGCKHGLENELTGKRCGKLTILERDTSNPDKKDKWLCLCDCGEKKSTDGFSLRTGRVQSCGCLAIIKATTHGKSYASEYATFYNAIDRCTNSRSRYYKHYGGRGITVCRGWREDFANFYEDMGPRPGKEYSLDRIDNDKNYSCGKCDECIQNGWTANCRWATRKEQMNNRRVSKKYKSE